MPALVMLWLKSAAGSALAFLKSLNPWQLALLALGIFALVQHFQLVSERRHSAKLQAQVVSLTIEIQRITSARDTQTKVTEHNVRAVEQGPERVRTVVKTIHDAPNPEDCKTPGLANLREVL